MKLCFRCQTLPRGRNGSYCDPCQADLLAESFRLDPRGQLVIAAKSAPCSNCGNSFPPPAMDLHHLRDKRFALSITSVRRHSIEEVREEIAKCVPLCACCHRVEHAYRTLEDDPRDQAAIESWARGREERRARSRA